MVRGDWWRRLAADIARTAGDLVELCAAPEADPLRIAAIHFCEGFVVGAHAYRQSVLTPGTGYCLPNPPPMRDQAIAMYVAWARRNPTYLSERPVDNLMRFTDATWPCKR
jgi:hypothetical protein